MTPSTSPPARRDDALDVATVGEVMTLLTTPWTTPLRAAAALDVGYAGAEANTAVGLARLGHAVAFGGRLGDDALGHRIAGELRREGIDVSGLSFDGTRPTGLLIRDLLTGRPGTVQYHRAGSAASDLGPEQVDEDAVRRARVLHLTGITAVLSDRSRAACLHALDVARDAGTIVCFDPNVRLRLAPGPTWRATVEEIAARADIALCGADDARACGVDADPAAWLHELGVPLVVVKDGAAGAWESQDGTVVRGAAHPVPVVVDAVGAGDAFAAGWLSGWLRGLAPADRLAEAAVVAACVVATAGDVPGLPDAAMRDGLLTAAGVDVIR
jgi:2-dehydro-3-deoxygluconokinase